MFFIHNWFDAWRILNLLIGLLCFVWSIGGFVKQHVTWNLKSLNMWYSRMMWAITTMVISFEGLNNHRGWSYTLGFLTITGFSSFFALYIKGQWGYVPPVTPVTEKDKPAKRHFPGAWWT